MQQVVEREHGVEAPLREDLAQVEERRPVGFEALLFAEAHVFRREVGSDHIEPLVAEPCAVQAGPRADFEQGSATFCPEPSEESLTLSRLPWFNRRRIAFQCGGVISGAQLVEQ